MDAFVDITCIGFTGSENLHALIQKKALHLRHDHAIEYCRVRIEVKDHIRFAVRIELTTTDKSLIFRHATVEKSAGSVYQVIADAFDMVAKQLSNTHDH